MESGWYGPSADAGNGRIPGDPAAPPLHPVAQQSQQRQQQFAAQAVPEQAVPQPTVPEHAVPEHAVPEHGNAAFGHPQGDTHVEPLDDSTPTATLEAARSKPRSGLSAGARLAQIAMAVLFVLAVVATTVMVFTDNTLWMRIGLLAALWSALVGAFLFARERRQSSISEEREAELKRVYSLELENEVAARREHDMRVKESLREEIRSENEDALNSLRVEIIALRSQLEQLGVQPIVDGGRAVAGSAAQRIIAASPGGAQVPLPAEVAANDSAPRPPVRRVDGFASFIGPDAETVAPTHGGEVPPRPRVEPGSRRDDTDRRPDPVPSAEVTSTLSRIDASAAPERPDVAERPSTPPIQPTPVPERKTATRHETATRHASGATGTDSGEPSRHTRPADGESIELDSFRLTAMPDFGGDAALPDFDAPTGFEPTGLGASAPEDQPYRGRRRAPETEETRSTDATDETTGDSAGTLSRRGREGGTSVADLLARFGDSGASAEGEHRHRRRSDS